MEIGTGMMCVFALCISGSYFMGNSLLTLIFVMAFTISFAFFDGTDSLDCDFPSSSPRICAVAPPDCV